MMPPPKISVLILTFNEELNLPDCLRSVAWCDDVVVFDSFSTDQTVDIAKAAGVRVIQHTFTDFGSQREASLRLGGFKHSWVLILDADERPDAGLKEEIETVLAQDPSCDAYRLRRKDHFLGHWIRRSTQYPVWFVRLLRHGSVHYEPRSVHEYPAVAPGRLGQLQGHLLHFSFNKGLGEWVEKHNRYAALEAAEAIRGQYGGGPVWHGLLDSDPVTRRKAQKRLFQRLPFRPVLRFVYTFIWKRSFLDGSAGFHYTLLLAYYEYLISLKVKELRRRQKGLPV